MNVLEMSMTEGKDRLNLLVIGLTVCTHDYLKDLLELRDMAIFNICVNTSIINRQIATQKKYKTSPE